MATKTKKKAPSAKPSASGEKADNLMHGVSVLGNVKKGGDPRRPISAHLQLSQITPIKDFNPRSNIGDITVLAKSIKQDGLLSPLVVRPAGKDGKFELIAGERRYRALESLDWNTPVSVTIRTDLDDDDRALAVAVAENSSDGRTNLNPIELGRVCAKLVKKKWDINRIARETGHHVQQIRRVLRVMEQPEKVREKIAEGTVSMNAGLELAKMTEKDRDDVVKLMDAEGATHASDIRRIRKQVENERTLEAAATEGPRKTKRGTTAKRVATAWRGSREKQEMLQQLCAKIATMTRDESDPDFIETRAQVAVLLWDRGDQSSLALPSEDADDAGSKKALKVFWAIVGQESAKLAASEPTKVGGEGDTDEGSEEPRKVKKPKSGKKKPKSTKDKEPQKVAS